MASRIENQTKIEHMYTFKKALIYNSLILKGLISYLIENYFYNSLVNSVTSQPF